MIINEQFSPKKTIIWFFILVIGAALQFLGWYLYQQPVTPPPISYPFECLSYDPFYAIPDYNPKEKPQVTKAIIENDLSFLEGKTDCIRIYTSLYGMEQVPEIAKKYGMTVMAGVWLDNEFPNETRRDFDAGIKLANSHDNITHLVIGNEILFFNTWSKDRLVHMMKEANERTDVPISFADMPFIWEAHADMIRHTDFVMIHAFPFWAGDEIEGAAYKVVDDYFKLKELAGDKPVIIGETGWPTEGPTKDYAVPSRKNQTIFIREFKVLADFYDIPYNIVEAFDQPWKLFTQEGRSGPHFGLWNRRQHQKIELTGPITVHRNWWKFTLLGTTLAFIVTLFFAWFHRRITTKGFLIGVLFLHLLMMMIMLVLMGLIREYMFQRVTLWLWVIPPQLLLYAVTFVQFNETLQIIGKKPLKKHNPHKNNDLDKSHQPFVSLHIPCCNENPDMVIATVKGLANLQYEHYEAIIIDNNTADEATWKPVEQYIKNLGNPKIKFHHEAVCEGFKAGALNLALKLTDPKAEIIGVVDADYIVNKNWLKEVCPLFKDENVAVVQCPQAHSPKPNDKLERIMNDELDGFFGLGMVQRNEVNGLIQHGTMTLIRKKDLHNVGNWSEWCICEDAELGLKLLEQGKDVIYVREVMGKGILPSSFKAYEKQRYRWAYGAISIIKSHFSSLIGRKSGLNWRQRYEFLGGWLPWVGDGLYPFFTILGLVGSVIILIQPRFFPPPEFFYPLMTYVVFRIITLAYMYNRRLGLSIPRTLAAMASGAALTNAIAMGVYRAFIGRAQAFERTDKAVTTSTGIGSLLNVLKKITKLRSDIAFSLILITLATIILRVNGWSSPEARFWFLGSLVLSLPTLCWLGLRFIELKNERKQMIGWIKAKYEFLKGI